MPDDGLSIDALATNCVIQPVQGLPALHDADLTVHIVGRDAQIALSKATADLPSGRKLVMSSGLFEVPDTAPHEPPARVHFKLDGPVPAAAELLAMDRLRDAAAGVPFDPATTRGTMSALVTLGMPLKPDLPPGSTNYAITVDATNFSADHMIMGQKVEAAALKVSANNQGFALKGDVKIGGTPASLEYRKVRGDDAADINIQGMLDETCANNLGLDPAQHDQRRHSDRSHRPRRHRAGPRRPLRRRGRSDVGADRRLPAGLGQAGRQAGARDVHAHHQAAIDPHRRSSDRGRRRRRQRHHRARRLGRICNRPISRPTAFPTATAPA